MYVCDRRIRFPIDELILCLSDNLGLMPYRRRIVSVSELFCNFHVSHLDSTSIVGRPIHIQKCNRPTIEEVTRVQTLYIEELTRSVRFPSGLITSLMQLPQHLEHVQGRIRKDTHERTEHRRLEDPLFSYLCSVAFTLASFQPVIWVQRGSMCVRKHGICDSETKGARLFITLSALSLC